MKIADALAPHVDAYRSAVGRGDGIAARRALAGGFRALAGVADPDRAQAAMMCAHLADLRGLLWHDRPATALARLALRHLPQTAGARSLVATCEGVLGAAAWRASDPAGALGPFERRARLTESLELAPHEAFQVWTDYALTLQALGRHDEAIGAHERALAHAERSGIAAIRFSAGLRLSNGLQKAGRLARARTLLEGVRPSDDASAKDRVRWHNAAAILQEDLGDLQEANLHYDEAQVAAMELPPAERRGVANVLFNSGETKLRLGYVNEARWLLHVLEETLSDGTENLAGGKSLLAFRAAVAAADGRDDDARAAHAALERLTLEATGAGSEDHAAATAEHAEYLLGAGRTAEALAHLQAHFARLAQGGLGIGVEQVTPLLARGRALLTQGSASEAGRDFRSACALELPRGTAEHDIAGAAGLGAASRLQGRMAAAVLLGKIAALQVCSTIDPFRDREHELAHLLVGVSAIFTGLIEALVDSGRVSEAISTQGVYAIEKVAARGVRSTEKVGVARIPLTSEERVLERRLAAIRASARGETRAGVSDADVAADFERTISEILDERWHRRVDGAVHAVGRAPAEGEAVLRILPGHDRIVLAWQAGGRDRQVTLEARPAEVRQEIFRLLRAIDARGNGWRQPARTLHDWLIGPFASDLASCRRLAIGAADAFTRVPFACLHDGTRFLVEQVDLCFVHGVGDAPPIPSPPRTGRAVILGVDRFDEDAPLPQVAREIERVAARFDRTTVLYNEGATAASLSEAVRLPADVLHVASHFHLDVADIRRCWLALGAGRRLSYSRMREVMEDARVRTVFLASCDTGVAAPGEHMVESLCGLMLGRGAETVVGAIWAVPDAGPLPLIERFYETLESSGAVGALAAAQRSCLGGLRDERTPVASHPFTWAGFAAFVA